MSAGKMSGSPWHVEYLHSDGKKQRKENCRNYIKSSGNCLRSGIKCYNAARCGVFEKLTSEDRQLRSKLLKKAKSSKKEDMLPAHENRPSPPQKKGQCVCPVTKGMLVNSAAYGRGRVIKVEGNRISVSFKERVKEYSWLGCLDSIKFSK